MRVFINSLHILQIMGSRVALDDYSLRVRLINVGTEAGDKDIVNIAKNGCIEEIANALAKSEKYDEIVTIFFKGFRGSEQIIDTFLAYKNSKYAFDVAKAIGAVTYMTEDIETTEAVAKTLHTYKDMKSARQIAGLFFDRANFAYPSAEIKNTAKRLNNPNAIKTIAAYQNTEEDETVTSIIWESTSYTKNDALVNLVANTSLKYRDLKGRKIILGYMDETIFDSKNNKSIENIVILLSDEKMLETMKSYQNSKYLKQVARILGETTHYQDAKLAQGVTDLLLKHKGQKYVGTVVKLLSDNVAISTCKDSFKSIVQTLNACENVQEINKFAKELESHIQSIAKKIIARDYLKKLSRRLESLNYKI